MKLIKITEIFNVQYGNQLDLNKMDIVNGGICFVSRTAKNNGVSAFVKELPAIQAFQKGSITVALGGSTLSTFLQPSIFYTGQNVAVLTDKLNLTNNEKLYYCLAIKTNAFRYTTCGREANRTLPNLLIPRKEDIPEWVYGFDAHCYEDTKEIFSEKKLPQLQTFDWRWFEIQDLFTIKKGKRLTKANMTEGDVPFIGAIDSNNGCRQYIAQLPNHKGNTITVNYNGNGVAEGFYQPKPFSASDDVNVLYPKFKLNQFIALFITTIIRLEKYRFNYGRKWHMQRMNVSKIKRPVTTSDGRPDFSYMENYIKSLPFSKMI